MTTPPPLVRFAALAGPLLLLGYGVLRLIDGLDGSHGSEPYWSLGHTLFFLGIILFGVLAVGLLRLVPRTAGWPRPLAKAATVASLFGAACFLWVIAGDLFQDFHDAAHLPDVLMMIGPLLFELGQLTLLSILASVRPRRLPAWSPVLVLVGFVALSANLDLLPLSALLVLAGLTPLVVKGRRVPVR
ncbi:MAG: hypothetical protein WCA46_19245 [Actinocatenispora sp.]